MPLRLSSYVFGTLAVLFFHIDCCYMRSKAGRAILLRVRPDTMSIICLRLEGHLGMRVFVTPLTPKLMHTPHKSAQIRTDIAFTVAVADAAASVLCCSLSCSCAVTCRARVPLNVCVLRCDSVCQPPHMLMQH